MQIHKAATITRNTPPRKKKSTRVAVAGCVQKPLTSPFQGQTKHRNPSDAGQQNQTPHRKRCYSQPQSPLQGRTILTHTVDWIGCETAEYIIAGSRITPMIVEKVTQASGIGVT
jgi:hypothetical protein